MTPPARLLIITAIALGVTAVILSVESGIFRPMSISFQFARAVATPVPAPLESSPDSTAAARLPGESPGNATLPDIAVPPSPEISRNMPAWERQIESVASDPAKNDAERARAVLALLAALPEDALAAAAERAVERLPDLDYAAVALPVVVDPRTHHRALSVLFADLMERPDPVTLPALLRIARNPEHAFAPSARDNLELLLGADFGGDWARWEAAVQGTLGREAR